jgi:hypothetical protein
MIDKVVFLLDVDNTLLDNDRVIDDSRNHLLHTIGSPCADRYWALFEEIRSELGYADDLGALQRYRIETMSNATLDPILLQLSPGPLCLRSTAHRELPARRRDAEAHRRPSPHGAA